MSDISGITPCPDNSERAEQNLKKYLSVNKNVKELHERYGLSINHTSTDNVSPLQGDMGLNECQSLIENSPWLERSSEYSFYKADGYYFIVTYSQNNEGSFKREGISIFNENFERVAVVIDIGTSK